MNHGIPTFLPEGAGVPGAVLDSTFRGTADSCGWHSTLVSYLRPQLAFLSAYKSHRQPPTGQLFTFLYINLFGIQRTLQPQSLGI